MKKEILIVAVLAGLAGTAVSAQGMGDRGGMGMQSPMNIEQLDTDGDGALSLAEIQAGPAVAFAAADTDGNGTLSAEEIEAMIAARAEARAEDNATRMLERLDENEDGVLSAEELQGKRGDNAEKMFERLDANEDGVLSAEELEAARDHMGDREQRPGAGKRH